MAENQDKGRRYSGYTEAHGRAHKKYMERFIEVRVRVTPEERDRIKEMADGQGLSVSALIRKKLGMDSLQA